MQFVCTGEILWNKRTKEYNESPTNTHKDKKWMFQWNWMHELSKRIHISERKAAIRLAKTLREQKMKNNFEDRTTCRSSKRSSKKKTRNYVVTTFARFRRNAQCTETEKKKIGRKRFAFACLVCSAGVGSAVRSFVSVDQYSYISPIFLRLECDS